MNRAERRRQERLMAKSGQESQTVSVNQTLEEAVTHHRGGRFQQAEQLYRKILETQPTHADALHLLGLLDYQRSEYDRALDLIAQAIRQNKKNPLYHYNHALTCEKAGRLDEAIRSYLMALHLKSNYVEAQSNLGNVYRQQGDLDAALKAFEQAIKMNPEYAGGYNNLGVILKEKRELDRAIDAYQEALRLNPQNAESYYNLGMVYVEREQADVAAAAFRKAIEIKPGYAKAHHNLGLMLLWQGEQEAALSQFRISANLLQNHGQPVPVKNILPSRIKHDIEQLEYLEKQNVSLPITNGYSETLHALHRQEVPSQDVTQQPIVLSQPQAQALAPSFNRILHYADNPILSDGVLNPNLDREAIQQRYQSSQPEIIFIDNLLREEALASLLRFCLESTIWKKDYVEGYIGAFLSEGFASPLLLQVAEELRQGFPEIFHQHQLLQAWAFKQDSQRRPLNIHADAAAVNVNFWITPNEANLDPTCGGLIVWDKEAPQDWDFKVYNSSKYKPKIMEFLRSSGASPVTVPYRQNRALIFNSDLFHESDRCLFRDGYDSRRMNITFLYGHRS